MQRVAFFGGSFDPPHVAHQMAALWALETGHAERVIWVPCYRHAFGKALAPFDDRFEMCLRSAAFLGDRAEVSRVEAEIGGESRTLVTLKRLRDLMPGAQWVILIGADLDPERQRWLGHDEIVTLAEFLVVGRGDQTSPAGAPALPAISSSEIRARLARNEDVSALIPARVRQYIAERGLYRAPA